MTPERAKELLPIIQAFSEGKKIECQVANNSLNKWEPTAFPTWSPHYNYRIAKEKKWYRVALLTGGPSAIVSIADEIYCNEGRYNQFIKWISPRVYYEVE